MDSNKMAGEETGWQLHKNAACNPEQVLAAAPHKTPTVRPPAPYYKLGDADYAEDIAILANTPDQAETLLHSLERAAASIGLYVNAHKTEYMCYNQTGDISTLEGTPLKRM